jgi:hypothetical protein
MKSYKDLSINELHEELYSENLNQELLISCIERQNSLLDTKLEELSLNNDLIKELFSVIRNYPSYIKVKYYPLKDQFDSPFDGLNFNIPEEKIQIYKSISSDSDFYVDLNFIKDQNKLINYTLENKIETKKKFINSAILGHALALGIAVSASIGFYNHIDSKANAAINKTQIVSSQGSNFLDSYEEAIKEMGKSGHNLTHLSSLNNHDVNLLLSLQEHKNEDPQNYEAQKDDVIASIKEILSPYIKGEHKDTAMEKIAQAIYNTSKTQKIDYLLFLSIMKVETTTFDQSKVSETGDISIAQIKPEVWEKEFIRLKRKPLDKKRLKKDSAYAIDRMGEILHIIQSRHKDDPYWYARYHSGTPKHKMAYSSKVQQEYTSFKSKQIRDINDKIGLMLQEINSIQSDSEISTVSKLFINFDKIESFKKDLLSYQYLINGNKYKVAFNN